MRRNTLKKGLLPSFKPKTKLRAANSNNADNSDLLSKSEDIRLITYNDLLLAANPNNADNSDLLTKSEEIRLINLYQKSSEKKYFNNLLIKFLPLIRKKIKTIKGRKIGFEDQDTYNDLLSAAFEGFYKAVQNFDSNKGFRLSSLADYYVSGSIKNYDFKNRFPVHIPESTSLKKIIYNYKKCKEEIESEGELSNPNPEIAKKLGVKEKYIPFVINNKSLSLNKKISNTNKESKDLTYLDLLSTEEFADAYSNDFQDQDQKLIFDEEKNINKNLYEKGISILNSRQQKIIRWRYPKHKENKLTLKEIAKRLKVSNERVRQIEETSINLIKKFIKKNSSFELKNINTS